MSEQERLFSEVTEQHVKNILGGISNHYRLVTACINRYPDILVGEDPIRDSREYNNTRKELIEHAKGLLEAARKLPSAIEF